MTWNALLPLLIVLSSAVASIVIFALPEEREGTRTALNLFGAVLKLVLIGFMLFGVAAGEVYELRFTLLPGFDFLLSGTALAMLFVTLSAVLWLVTTIYAVAYMAGAPNRSRFFGFFSLCVSATTGIALAGNPLTFLIFYEALTLTTYPLVVYHGTKKALEAGRVYLAYTLTGGAVLLLAVIWLHVVAGPVDFLEGGQLWQLDVSRFDLISIFALFILGLGVKAAIVPFHSWLPIAMVAPAPVSALLHAVAVVKAGVFGIVRVVYDVFGIVFSATLGVMQPLAILSSITILYGSLQALIQDDLKRRLAFSTVSQLSYIILGVAIVGPTATIGGLAHLVHQGLMKVTLFFCAGNLALVHGIHKVSEMNGVGRRMPLTMGAFTVGALGMIGLPPLAGFVSKWYLGVGAVETGQTWIVGVLVVSSLLNMGYFLPILFRAWFLEPTSEVTTETGQTGLEAHWMLLLPPLFTAALTVIVGLFAAMPFSVLEWAKLITAREYIGGAP